MRVFITGVAGTIGRLVAEQLAGDPTIEHVTGFDTRPCRPPVPGMQFVRATPQQPEWTPLLDHVDVAVHVGGLVSWPARRGRETTLVADSKHILRAMLASGVRKIIVANSGAIYGARSGHPARETDPVRGHQDSAYARARAEIADFLDVLVRDRPDVTVTRLRAAPITGPRYLAPVRYFAGGPVLACGREDRVFQALHEDDLVSALRLAIHHDLPGIYNVCADRGVSYRELAALLDRDQTCAPLAWIVLRAWWLWSWWRRRTPPNWVRSLYRGPVVSAERLLAAGWTPRHTTRDAAAAAYATFQTGA